MGCLMDDKRQAQALLCARNCVVQTASCDYWPQDIIYVQHSWKTKQCNNYLMFCSCNQIPFRGARE